MYTFIWITIVITIFHSVITINWITISIRANVFVFINLFLMLGIPFGIAGSLCAALMLNNDFRCSRMRRVYGIVIVTVILIVSCSMLILAGAGFTAMTLLVCGIVGTILVLGSIGGQTVYRTLFYFPSFTAGVATYILWKKLYSPENGPINNVLQPVLDRISPLAGSMSLETAHFGGALLIVLMGIIYAYVVFRLISSWKNGETGSLSYCIALALLSIPLVCCQLWSRIPWGGALGLSLVTLGVLFSLLMFLTGRDYRCVCDCGMSNAIVLDGMVMVGLFICLGLSNVILALPTMASGDGLTAPKWISDYYWAKPSLMIMGGLQGGFETARTMTQGGPAGSTTTLAYYIYSEGFNSGRLGYASAVAWTLFILVFCVTLFNWKFGNRYTND